MTATGLELDALLGDGLDRRREELRHRKLGHFSPVTLLWLAAVPEWSDRTAAAIGFPLGAAESLGQLLEQLEAASLVERREVVEPTGEIADAFWMPRSRRGEVGRYLQQLELSPDVADVVTGIAARLEERLGHSHSVELRQWLRVVSGYRSDQSGVGLMSAADALIADGATTEALSLVSAAQALGDVLGEPLLSAARRVQWRVDRAYRETLDARSLSTYLPRPEVEGKIATLISGHAPWALHLLGDGGVGKTMTIRYLASGQFADRWGLPPLAVARVDFDHLDPRFPERRPVELLLALAGELAGFTSSRAALYQMRRFDDSAHVVHERLGFYDSANIGRERHATSQTMAAGEDALGLAVDAFADYLNELGTPTVLVLDTCEELAKLHAPGTSAPAIDRTFDLLERVHTRAPQMRALLAGRRWLTTPPEEAPRTGGLATTDRAYLRVLHVGGFTKAQAEDYLTIRDPEGTISAPLRAAVLERSGESAAGGVNPFDLSGYCEWALADPRLDPTALRTAPGDPYVEQRIIGRLTDTDVRDALPVAVELGRFDQSMVEPALARRGINPVAAFTGLAGQEWVSVARRHADGRPWVLEVDEHLRSRIRALVAGDRSRFPLDRHMLGKELSDLVLRGPVEQLSIEAVEAAIRLLAPTESGRMWARLEQNIARDGAWAWAGQMTPRAAATEVERAGTGPTILAAIRATQAAAALRMPGRPGLMALWEDVTATAHRHPDPDTAASLSARAVCGLVAAGRVDADFLASLGPAATTAGRADSLLAALDSLVRLGVAWPVETSLLDGLCDTATDSRVRANALLIRAADRLAGGDLHAAVEDADDAIAAAPETGGGRGTSSVDWVAPARLLDRARLARVHLALVRGEPLHTLPGARWREETTGHLDDIDAERLAAATVSWELAWGLVDEKVIAALEPQERYNPRRQPISPWHHRTPALCPAIALALAAGGEVSRAATALRRRREEAVSSGEDPRTISSCDATLVGLCRVARTTQLTSAVSELALDADPDLRAEAWAVLTLVRGRSPASPEEAGSWHAWWRVQTRDSLGVPLRLAYDPPPANPALLTADSVDAIEIEALGGTTQPPDWYADLENSLRRVSEDGFLLLDGRGRTLGDAVRAKALLGDRVELSVEHLPPRAVAEAAMSEGELLALRLPQRGAALLRQAAERFRSAGDYAGERRATALAVLALARDGREPPDEEADLLRRAAPDRTRPRGEDFDDGWPLRLGVARAAADDVLRPAHDPSPELAADVTHRASPPPGPMSAASPASYADAAAPPAQTSRSGRRTVIAVVAGSVAAVALLGLGTAVLYLTRSDLPVVAQPGGLNVLWLLLVLVVPISMLVIVARVRIRGRAHSSAVVPAPESSVATTREMPFRWRRYAQQTVALRPGSGGSPWFACTITPTPGGLIVRAQQAGNAGNQKASMPRPADLSASIFRSSRAYVVVPIVDPVTVSSTPESAWEQQQGRSTTSLGGLRPLWVRFVDRVDPAEMRWEPGQLSPSNWAGSTSEFHGPAHLKPTSARTPSSYSRSGTRRVAHYVGTPVPTIAGWRLRVGGALDEASQSVTRSKLAGEDLLGADELAMAATGVVVLQTEPVDGPPEPLGHLRPGMVNLARSLILRSGAGAVLLIPSLPDLLAAKIIDSVWRFSDTAPEHFHPVLLLDLLDDLRMNIALAEPPEFAMGDRPSLDVCLFL